MGGLIGLSVRTRSVTGKPGARERQPAKDDGTRCMLSQRAVSEAAMKRGRNDVHAVRNRGRDTRRNARHPTTVAHSYTAGGTSRTRQARIYKTTTTTSRQASGRRIARLAALRVPGSAA